MSTPSHIGTESAATPSIKPYWDFARNPENKNKTIVAMNGNKLGIAVPLKYGDNHITFLNKEGLELCSDEHTKSVSHFKEALTNKYQSKYGDKFLAEIFSSDDLEGAALSGLSHHVISQVYEKVCRAELAPLFKEIAISFIEAEKACSEAAMATPRKAREYALEARKQADQAQKLKLQVEKIAVAFPNDKQIQANLKNAKYDVKNAAASAKEAAEIVDRNRRVLNGPPLNADYLNKKKSIENLSTIPGDKEGDLLKRPSDSAATDPKKSEIDQNNTETNEKKGELLKRHAKAAHDAVFAMLDANRK